MEYDIFTFKGTCLEECDLPRLNTHARRVWDAMVMAINHSWCECCKTEDMGDYFIHCNGGWVELNELSRVLNIPHSSLSACVRAFRYDENGGHTVETKRAKDGKGTWLYKLVPNTPDGVKAAKARAASRVYKGTPPFQEGQYNSLLQLKAWIVLKNGNGGGWWLSNPEAGAKILEHIDQMINDINV